MTSFIDWLGDRCNPILVKEIRQAVYGGYVTTGFLLLLGVELVMTIGMIIETGGVKEEQGAILGQKLFDLIQKALSAMFIVLMPLGTALRFASERRDAHENLLFITALSPRAIITGKFLFAAAIVMLVFSAFAPLIILCFALGGMDIQTIVSYLAFDFLAGLFCMMLALLLISIGRSVGVIIPLLSMFLWVQMSASIIFLRSKLEFWQLLAGFGSALIGVSGLMYCWTIALLSPPASNRAFPVRLYTASLWLTGAIVCSCIIHENPNERVPIVYGFVGLALFAFQFLVSICERDTLGPRVIRCIPQRLLLRIPAFLFSSGAAGGILFSIIGMAVSIVWVAIWREELPRGIVWARGAHYYKIIDIEIIWSMALFTGYTYCYLLSAVGVRRLLRKTAFPSNLTCVIAVILFALGVVFPHLLSELFYPDYQIYAVDTSYLLTSPYDMVDRLSFRHPQPWLFRSYWGADENTKKMVVSFLVIWGTAITLLNAKWFLIQVKNFRPSSPAPHTKSTEILVLEPSI